MHASGRTKRAVKAHTHEFLCGHKFSTSLGKYQGMQLMDHMVRVCLVYKRDHQTTL